jgi:CRP-like cAMP-binding protein
MAGPFLRGEKMTKIHILKEVELFRDLTEEQLENIARNTQERVYDSQQNIFEHGQEAKSLYVLLDGAVDLKIRTFDGIDLMTSKLTSKGDVFGTASVMSPPLYNVTAKCLENTRMLAIDAYALRGLIDEDPILGLEVMRQLAQLFFGRLNETRRGITNLFKVFRLQGPEKMGKQDAP